jgi:ribonuclease J
VDRVQQVINTAHKYGRKVVVEGRSMINIINIASELGYIQIPDKTLIDIDELRNFPDNRTVLITTGSQGESMAALSRMANGMHKKIQIKPTDLIIFSSHPIPGNEKAVSNVINELFLKGADVIFQDVHVSGHACRDDIKLIYSLVKPKYAIPVHGEYRHLKAQAAIAEELGVAKDHIFILTSGDVLALNADKAAVVDRVPCGKVLVDGLGVGDVGNVVLRDRKLLAEEGIIIVVLTLEKGSNQVLAGPELVSRGFVYVRESGDLLTEAQAVLEETVDYCQTKGMMEHSRLRSAIRDAIGDFVWRETKRRPMVIPIIMEVS